MSPLPSRYAPMLAASAGRLPDRLADWAIEPKWDGIRVIAEASAKGVRLWTRNGNDKAPQFPEIVRALKVLADAGGPLVLDGEIIALDARGRPLRFQALQGRMHAESEATLARHAATTTTAFVAFDLLADGDRPLTSLPFSERRTALEGRVPARRTAIVRRGESVRCGSAAAKKLFERARTEGWEGVLLKRVDAPYVAGKRTPDWRKVKLEREQEFVIGGYTDPAGSRTDFGALLAGYYEGNRLRYAGKVGTGYSAETLRELGARLRKLETSESPFADARPIPRGTHWTRPELVAQIGFAEWTGEGRLRQPRFLGLRDDKRPMDVVRERPS